MLRARSHGPVAFVCAIQLAPRSARSRDGALRIRFL